VVTSPPGQLPLSLPPRSPGAVLRWSTLAIVAFAVGASLLAGLARQAEVETVIRDSLLRARGAAADVNRYVQSQRWTLQVAAEAPAVRSSDTASMSSYFDRIDPESLGFDGGIFWVDASGMMRARSGYSGPPLDFRDRDYVQDVLRTGLPSVPIARFGQVNQAPIVPMAVPTQDETGALHGLLAGAIRLDQLRLGSESLRRAGGTEVTIVDRRGQLIAGAQAITSIRLAHPDFMLAPMQGSGEGVLVDVANPYGEGHRLIGYALAPVPDWLVLVDEPVSMAFAAADQALLAQLAVILATAALVIVLLLWAARRLDLAFAAHADAYAAERQLRGSLETAVAQLREREELREAFTGVLSHELRTPVTTIYGIATLLARSPGRADAASLAEDIEDESDRLRRIIEDLLVLSRAERGHLAVPVEPVLVQRLAPAVIAELHRRYPSTPFELRLSPDLAPVAAEPGALRQVLANLLANAAKYGQGAHVRLIGRNEGSSVRIIVEDDGPGFAEEEASRLFDLFYRSPRTAQVTAGTGIGLFVVKQLVGAMDGTVCASMRTPRGASFEVSLRVYEPDTEEEGTGEAETGAARRSLARPSPAGA
jgi:signal transduction histidine kinase